MSKIFAGELVGELVAGGELAAATGGLAVPFEFLGLGIQGMIMGIRHHKQKKEDKKNQQEEQMRKDEEARQQEMERFAREQEQRAEQQRIEAEQQRQAEEQKQADEQRQAEEQKQREADFAQMQQQRADIQRQQENQQNIQNMENRNRQISDQLARDREARIRGPFDPMNLTPGQGNDPENSHPEWGMPNPNWPNANPGPDDDPDDGPNNPFPGPNPPNPPDGPPANDPANQGGNNYNFNRNPYTDVMKMISDQIARNQNREKPAPKPEDDQPEDQQILGKDGAGTWKPEYQTEEYKNQQNSENYPGKNGGGIQKKDSDIYAPDYITKNDDTHLIENELLAIINNQGLSELNQEATLASTTRTVQELQNLENKIPEQAQVSSIFSQTISRF